MKQVMIFKSSNQMYFNLCKKEAVYFDTKKQDKIMGKKLSCNIFDSIKNQLVNNKG